MFPAGWQQRVESFDHALALGADGVSFRAGEEASLLGLDQLVPALIRSARRLECAWHLRRSRRSTLPELGSVFGIVVPHVLLGSPCRRTVAVVRPSAGVRNDVDPR